MVANFRPQKDHPTLVRALATLSDDLRERCTVVVIGSTTADVEYHAGCIAMAEQLGVADRLRIIGPRDDLPEVLAGADAGPVRVYRGPRLIGIAAFQPPGLLAPQRVIAGTT
jgi:glycosyltransferase involved in cell wall biosynthesis